MKPNIDPRNGIAYGCHSHNGVASEIITEVFESGVNTTDRDWADGILETCFENRFVDVLNGDTPEETMKQINAATYAGLGADDIKELIRDHYDCRDDIRGEFDFSDLSDDLIQLINDRGSDSSEHRYVKLYTNDAGERIAIVQISWLGGAPGLDVLWSTDATYCRCCSPCAMNAGDLDAATTALHGNSLAYCLPPEVIGELEPGEKPWYREVIKVKDYEAELAKKAAQQECLRNGGLL